MRPVNLLLLAVLAACPGGKTGSGSIETSEHAPWSLDGVRSVLFMGSVDDDRDDGEAYILITTEELGCEDLDEDEYIPYDTVEGGSGLVLLVGWDKDDPVTDLNAVWEGLYMSGYGYSSDSDEERFGLAAAFNEGFLYVVGGYFGGSNWTRIDSVSDSEVKAEFYTDFWWGEVEAVNCGVTIEEPRRYDTADTG